jgi:hypothetical protein
MPLKKVEDATLQVQENEMTAEDGAAALSEAIGTADGEAVVVGTQKMLDDQAWESGEVRETGDLVEEIDMDTHK